jgi:hypothetical protein
MRGGHPLNVLARTFFAGALAGFVFLIGASAASPEAAAALLDLYRDGIDVKDVFAWLFGHAAILIHHILPGIARV